VTSPWPDIGAAYDVVAQDYATTFDHELDGKPADRDLLDRLAATVPGRGQVWDIGCGAAGHITRYLADRGVDAIGVDISPGSLAVAGQRHRDLRFFAADMRDLPAADRSLAGIVAFYSVIHLPRDQVPAALAEFRRVLAPGGVLLMSMHSGEGEVDADEWFGHAVRVRATLVSLEVLRANITAAGFTTVQATTRPPYAGENPPDRQRLYVWAQPSPPPAAAPATRSAAST
jgi:SAM-dependent methyltransferase